MTLTGNEQLVRYPITQGPQRSALTAPLADIFMSQRTAHPIRPPAARAVSFIGRHHLVANPLST
jgi:hypothetical protein